MKNPYGSLLSTAWRNARGERGRIVLVYGLFLASNVLLATNALLMGWFVNSLQQDGTRALASAWVYVAGYAGLQLLRWALHGPARLMERRLAFNVSRNFLDALHHQLLHLPVEWHRSHHSGATNNRLRKAYGALKEFYQNGSVYFFSVTQFLMALGAMLYFSPLFGALGIGLGLVTIRLIFFFDKPFLKALEETNEKEHKVYAALCDGLSNIMTVITLRLEKHIGAEVRGTLGDVLPAYYRASKINEWKWFTTSMLVAFIYGAMIMGYVYENYHPGETFSLGRLLIMIGFVNQFTGGFNNIASQYNQLMQYDTDVQTVRGVTEAYRQQHRPTPQTALPAGWKSLRISDLNFSYPGGDVPPGPAAGPEHDGPAGTLPGEPARGLHGLHLHLRRGQRIALIGRSGSGKSTLLALLRGLYPPRPGVQLTADARACAWESISGAVTLFPQEPEIFENTVAYNITLGIPCTGEEIRRVCEVARFWEVVAQLPQGLDTIIRERGVNLSGGQKQRLALARGLLAARNSDILLLDEPTSSVDPVTEARIYEEIFRACSGKVVVSSLHRLHLLGLFDYVYVLEQGRIAAEGTPEEMSRRPAPASPA